MIRRATKVRRQDLVGHSLDRDAAMVRIDEETGYLYLVHVEGYLENGRHLLFNGEIRLSLKDFEWIE